VGIGKGVPVGPVGEHTTNLMFAPLSRAGIVCHPSIDPFLFR
jgi:hypothetical protein